MARSPAEDDGGTSQVRLRNDAEPGKVLYANAVIFGVGDSLSLPGPALSTAKLVRSHTNSRKLRWFPASWDPLAKLNAPSSPKSPRSAATLLIKQLSLTGQSPKNEHFWQDPEDTDKQPWLSAALGALKPGLSESIEGGCLRRQTFKCEPSLSYRR